MSIDELRKRVIAKVSDAVKEGKTMYGCDPSVVNAQFDAKLERNLSTKRITSTGPKKYVWTIGE